MVASNGSQGWMSMGIISIMCVNFFQSIKKYYYNKTLNNKLKKTMNPKSLEKDKASLSFGIFKKISSNINLHNNTFIFCLFVDVVDVVVEIIPEAFN